MALDGLVISSLVAELNETILNTKISKIAQPENDELLFTLKGSKGQFRLAMSASASLPFLYLTGTNKPSPLTAPNFCMVLRKQPELKSKSPHLPYLQKMRSGQQSDRVPTTSPPSVLPVM